MEDLTKVPGLGEGSAKEILDAVRELQRPAKKIAGYRRALEGIVVALESGQEMALAGRIAGGSYSKGRLLEIGEEMRSRASQEFRPGRERGYSEAWADVLEALASMKISKCSVCGYMFLEEQLTRCRECGRAYCPECAERYPTIKELGVCPDCEEIYEAALKATD
ncbi:MAG: hypothetical protein U9M97_03920 [Candidatus Hadarchaeota archaeon]|nr:hypothetical protein [Candidatus Hadarchaeota archaeon]